MGATHALHGRRASGALGYDEQATPAQPEWA
jgi:hypothetical protein